MEAFRSCTGLLRRLSLRLRFVVNKIDSIGTTEGMDEEETRIYVAELVTEQLAGNGFQLRPHEVWLHIHAKCCLYSVCS